MTLIVVLSFSLFRSKNCAMILVTDFGYWKLWEFSYHDFKVLQLLEAYSGPSQTSKMKLFAKIVKALKMKILKIHVSCHFC